MLLLMFDIYFIINANDLPAVLDVLGGLWVVLLDVGLHLCPLERGGDDVGEEGGKVLPEALRDHDEGRLKVVYLGVVCVEGPHGHDLLHHLQRVLREDLLPHRDPDGAQAVHRPPPENAPLLPVGSPHDLLKQRRECGIILKKIFIVCVILKI